MHRTTEPTRPSFHFVPSSISLAGLALPAACDSNTFVGCIYGGSAGLFLGTALLPAI